MMWSLVLAVLVWHSVLAAPPMQQGDNNTSLARTLPADGGVFNPPWLSQNYSSTTALDASSDWTSPNMFNDKNAPDCKWAGQYNPFTYMMCTSSWAKGSNKLEYRIVMSGTGQRQQGWCQGIYANIKGQCKKGKVVPGTCDTTSPDSIAYAVDGDNQWQMVELYGIDMRFVVRWPWNTDDANHECIARAVRRATCSSVDISNGVACRSDQFVGDLLEYDTRMGGAY